MIYDSSRQHGIIFQRDELSQVLIYDQYFQVFYCVVLFLAEELAIKVSDFSF